MMETQDTNLSDKEAIIAEESGEFTNSQQSQEELANVHNDPADIKLMDSNENYQDFLDSSDSLVSLAAITSTDVQDNSEINLPSRNEILDKLRKIVSEPQKYSRNQVDALRQMFYKVQKKDLENLKLEFVEKGGLEEDFIIQQDEHEVELKNLISDYLEKRNNLDIEEARQKENNLLVKQHLIERLKILNESQEDFNKRTEEFRAIQHKWKEIKAVPKEYQKELWRSYQLYSDRFYELIKINNQLREYDFKKNLEMKTELCETVEKLAEQKDVISSFHQLQKLHLQWKEIGPVAKEYRDSIWNRFKSASAIINKKHQTFFEELKEQEDRNLQEKKIICERIETIDYSTLKTLKEWENKTNEVLEMQSQWKKIGFASKRQNVKIFDRFRTACDEYFKKKGEFYKSIKIVFEKNLELKKALLSKAESMKDSTDWKETTKAFIELQNEWKNIGPVSRKHSDSIWKQFTNACDYFFDRKNKITKSHKSEENENFESKKLILKKIKAIDNTKDDETVLSELRQYINEWNNIGFVPFKEKDGLNAEFRLVTDKMYDKLKISDQDKKIRQYRSSITDYVGADIKKLYNERDKLMRIYDRTKGELQTYENNIGFFTVSSKGGNGLLKEMDKKINHLKDEMNLIIKKIDTIDENLNKIKD